jgi:hypothetical protein
VFFSLQPVTNGSAAILIRSRIFDPAHLEVCLLEENLIFALPAVHMPGFVGLAERAGALLPFKLLSHPVNSTRRR